ncbi:hypothetical protein Tco_0329405 [Tanacetum coccineum]
MAKKSSVVDLEIQEILESYFLGVPMSRLFWLKISYQKKFNRSLDESLGEETIEEHLDVMRQKDMVLLYEDTERNNTYVMSARMVENRRKILKSNVHELLDKHGGAIRLSSFEDIYKKKFEVKWDSHRCCLNDFDHLCSVLNLVVEGENLKSGSYNLRKRKK